MSNEKQPDNIIDGLLAEIARVTAMIIEYRSLEGGAGNIAAFLMAADITNAKEAIATLDTVGMITAYQALKQYEY